MADYNSKYSGEQIEQLLEQAGGGSAVTEQTVSGWGFTKNQGTITGVSANGTSVATSGVANIPAASTSRYGVTQLSSATNSTSTTLAATPSAVKAAYDLANSKQAALVSGTNIKTINGQSILGSGDLTIAGGGGSSDKVEMVGIYPVVNGDVWTYQIPAGKFVELVPADSLTSPSYIQFELLDPVENTAEGEGEWVGVYSKYHFTLMGLSVFSPFGFGTNTNKNATPNFYHNVTSITNAPSILEFDVVCALIHYPASTGYPDSLYGYITLASLYTN